MAESSSRFIALDKPIKNYIHGGQNKKTPAKTRTRKVLKRANKLTKEFCKEKKCLEARSKRLTRKQGKGNKSNGEEALTDDEGNILYEKYLH